MASMNVPVRVVGLRLDGEKLQLEVEDVGDEEWALEGTQEDLPAFKKLFGKTLPARLTIGAEEEQPAASDDVAQLQRELTAARERLAVLEQDAKVMRDELTNRGSHAPQPVTPADARLDANHPVAKVARGALTVIEEQAEKHMNAAKAAKDAALFGDFVRTTRAALLKLEHLVAPEKPANGKLALAPPPTVA